MTFPRWDQRFFASTRGRIVLLVRRATRTVEELAQALGLTDNAVRVHLAALERDGLVEQTGVRPSGGKPAYEYALTPGAESLFPKAYTAVLSRLLDVLQASLPSGEARTLLRETGRRLVAEHAPRTGQGPVAAAVALLEGLGGQVDVEQHDAQVVLRGRACPLADVVPDHPGVCDMAADMLSQVTGVPVADHCAVGDPPHCRFEITLPAPSAAPRGD
jgi:predicted ArsR family transcriptional regulator